MADAVSPPDDQRARILLIEDAAATDHVLPLLRTKAAEWEIDHVRTHADGLDVARRWMPDLIMASFATAEGPCGEFLRRLHADDRLRAIPLILLFPDADVPSRIAGLDAGADDCVGWPAGNGDLVARVRSVLRRARRHAAYEARFSADQARLELAMEAAGLGHWQWNTRTNEINWSPQTYDLLGVPRGTPVTPDSVEAIVHPDDVEHYRATRIRGGESHIYQNEYRIVLPSGSIRWIATRGRRVIDEDEYLFGVVMDITERKRAEMRMEAELSRLTSAFMLSPAFMCTLRGPDHIFEFVNERYYDLVGHRDILNKPFRIALPETRDQGFLELLDQVFATGRPVTGKDTRILLQRHPGKPIEESYVNFVYHPLHDAQGMIYGIFVHGVDVTEEKKGRLEREQLLNSELAARAEVERASRMKDEFLATLSHELRTPLNAILGWTTILQRGAVAPEVAQGLETIARNARAQARIIEDLLDMSRIISGKVRLDLQPIDLHELLRQSVQTVRAAADAKGIRLDLAIEPVGGALHGDAGRLQQVFWNLLNNAVKFTPEGGAVTVTLRADETRAEVTVTDTGEGIAAEFLPRIFKNFQQADASTTRRHGGLGLGLAIVKRLVSLHGGTVRAHSGGTGHGATFTVSLPLTAPGESLEMSPRASLANGALPSLAGTHVLVVDDEPDARLLVQRLLEDAGATVLTASSAAEAMTLLRTRKPHVLVCDIGMPGEDGYSLIRRIRTLPSARGGTIPAVALTAYTRSEDQARALAAGFQVHVTKPVEALELASIVEDLAARSNHLSSRAPRQAAVPGATPSP